MASRLAKMVCLLAIASALTATADAKVTFESLVKELTDLTSLSYFPDPPYTVKQFSSYDQRSKNPSVATDEDWFANGDRGQYLRAEDRNGAKEYVLMDADGPGAIVRIWSANPDDAGILRIYLDNAPDPVVELKLIDMLGGLTAPFIKPIAAETARGWSSYLPIPYVKHCKVTASKPDFYYHINYRTYEEGASLETYSAHEAEAASTTIQDAAALLANPSPAETKRAAKHFSHVELTKDQPTYAVQLPSQHRSDAIRSIEATVKAENIENALRGTMLEVTFDEQQEPNILVPLGDFFGTAPGLNKFASLPCGVTDDGVMYARWVMPYRDFADVRLHSTSDQRVTIDLAIDSGTYRWSDNSMYFHSGWRTEHPIKTRPRQDWNFLTATGKGRFVGTMLHVTNPVKAWWGEGDEKIYVDGESFPSHFGTGTEDYFGYAWCSPELFSHAYHDQPRCDGPANYGQTCVSRFHVIDNIPYTTSFKFDMEVWHWEECEIAMAETAYWYSMPGGTHAFKDITPADLKIIAPTPLPEPRRVEGALEGESLKVIEKTGGTTEMQEHVIDKWSGSAQLWWRDGKPGDVLTLAVPVERAGKYTLHAVFTNAVDYGIHTLAINGKEAAKDLDSYNNGVIMTPEQSLGIFDFTQGENKLTITVTGSNPKAIPKHMFGLDYVKLVPAN